MSSWNDSDQLLLSISATDSSEGCIQTNLSLNSSIHTDQLHTTDLQTPMITYTSERKYDCQKNEKTSNKKIHLNRQQFYHAGERSVDIESSLNQHQLVQTGEKKYGCGQKFF